MLRSPSRSATRRGLSAYRSAVSLLAMSTMLATQTAHGFTISNLPLTLPTTPEPNIVVTLDDSGSMMRAFAPDTICGAATTRRVRASSFNPIYYDPTVAYIAPLQADGTPLSTSFTAAYVNGFNTGLGAVNLSSQYRVSWEYSPSISASDLENSSTWNECSGSGSQASKAEHPAADYNTAATGDLRRQGVAAYYYVFVSTPPNCSGSGANTNDDCYQRRIVGQQPGPADLDGNGVVDADDERQNFANWFSFYRTRQLLTVSAASIAFRNPALANTRLTWQSLNSCNSALNQTNVRNCNGVGGNVDSRLRIFDDTHRGRLYNWLFRLPASGGTPLRAAAERAGTFFTTSGENSPYAENPQVSVGTELSCRQNFHILMTDGVWNESDGNFCSGSSCGNRDGTNLNLPDGRLYDTSLTETSIYRDSNSNSLSDVIFHYWATDLRPTLTNNVPRFGIRSDIPPAGISADQYWDPQRDPANWQRLTTFTVGLGLTNSLSLPGLQWSGSTWSGSAYADLRSGARSWPGPTVSLASPENVYDLWHAAINSRGQSFSANNPVQLNRALNDAMNRVLDRTSGSSAATVNTARISNDTVVFQALLNPGDWSGELRALRVGSDGSVDNDNPVWTTNTAGKIPAWGTRQSRVFTWNGSDGVAFTKSAMDDPASASDAWAQIAATPAAATPLAMAVADDDIMRYVLGDQSKEATQPAGIYRKRNRLLGDIVNSNPVFVGNQRFSYAVLPDGVADGRPYLSFVASKASRTRMIYVGSNSGMLHGFNAANGEEVFAFVPGAVLPNLRDLASPSYTHRYFVDGSPTAWDAYFQADYETAASWKTVLLGTTGAGARSVFALDVTNPTAMSASRVLWEINSATPQRSVDASDPDYADDLGFTIGEAAVGRMANGDWVAVFGNGYRSPNNQAVLYVVRLSDGALIRKFDTNTGSPTVPNGLGTPTLVDRNNDQIVDFIYAGDMLGNVWKFDMTSASASSWSIAYSGNPLFTAANASGAAQPISVRIRVTQAPAGVTGRMLLFGTGRLWANGDDTSTTAQTFYGILDNDTARITTGRSALRSQTISTNAAGTLRTVTTNAVDWSTQRGWFMDLPVSRERVIGAAQLNGDRVFFTSVIPTNDRCGVGASWLMQVNAQTGGSVAKVVFDTDGDGTVGDAGDSNASGVVLGGIVSQPALTERSVLSSGTGSTDVSATRRDQTIETGRSGWREIVR